MNRRLRVLLMRWFWIDRFEEFVRGKRAVAIKCVANSEEQVDNYVPGFCTMPASLMIEGMAQTGGLLIGEISGFQQRVVLAKIGKAVFQRLVRGGEMLRYTATVLDVKGDGAMCSMTSHIGDELVAEVEMMFAFLDDRFPSGPLFEPVDFAMMLMNFHLYDVGRTADGEPLELPPFYADAIHAAAAGYDSIPSPVAVRSNGAVH